MNYYENNKLINNLVGKTFIQLTDHWCYYYDNNGRHYDMLKGDCFSVTKVEINGGKYEIFAIKDNVHIRIPYLSTIRVKEDFYSHLYLDRAIDYIQNLERNFVNMKIETLDSKLIEALVGKTFVHIKGAFYYEMLHKPITYDFVPGQTFTVESIKIQNMDRYDVFAIKDGQPIVIPYMYTDTVKQDFYQNLYFKPYLDPLKILKETVL